MNYSFERIDCFLLFFDLSRVTCINIHQVSDKALSDKTTSLLYLIKLHSYVTILSGHFNSKITTIWSTTCSILSRIKLQLFNNHNLSENNNHCSAQNGKKKSKQPITICCIFFNVFTSAKSVFIERLNTKPLKRVMQQNPKSH